VDFKLENVLVSLHSLKPMGLGPFGASAPLFLRNGELLGHSPIRQILVFNAINTIVTDMECNISNYYINSRMELSPLDHY
jgi:hypothetical protein